MNRNLLNSNLGSTSVRVISALVAVGVLFCLWYFWGRGGVTFAAIVAVLGVQIEFSAMFLKTRTSNLIRWGFVAASLATLTSGIFFEIYSGFVFAIFGMGLFVLALVDIRRHGQVAKTLELVSLLSLGLFYSAVIPQFSIRLLTIAPNVNWFIALLGIIFAGDVFAYFIGLRFGKNKLWEVVSPKKTWEGAFGGAIGSVAAGAFFQILWFEQVPLGLFLMCAFLVGVSGQLGDLFESLLKRAAGVKDSGAIMPGHGGVMDRIDGVLFGGPFLYVLAYFFVTHK